jgi:hypothetical protein
MKKLLSVFILILSLSNYAQIQPVISTDRPSISDSSTIQDMGVFQIESGITYENKTYSYFQSTRFNLVNNTELRIGFDENILKEDNNLLLIGIKTLLYSNKLGFFKNIAFLIEGNVSSLEDFIITKIITDIVISPYLDVTTNLGYLKTTLGNSYPYSIVAAPRWDSNWTLYGEIYGNNQVVESTSWNVGALYRVTRSIQVDISTGKTFSSAGTYSSFGMSLNI